METINDELLYSFDILLDSDGRTELIYDFPSEPWKVTWKRESAAFQYFCNSGKAVLFLLPDGEYQCDIVVTQQDLANAPAWLHLPTGNLLAVPASELIQYFPELETDMLVEIEVESGWYNISHLIKGNIQCFKGTPQATSFRNVHWDWTPN